MDRYVDTRGYVRSRGKSEHIRIAEEVLGRPLKTYGRGHSENEVVHHINMDKTDNRHGNLLICTNAYHQWLHSEYERWFAKTLEPVL